MQVNVQESESQLSKLLELVENGEQVVISRDGKPIAELIPARKQRGLPLGIAQNAPPLVPRGNAWWKPLTDEEAEAWIDGPFKSL